MTGAELIISSLNSDMILKVLEYYNADKIYPLSDGYRCCCFIHQGDNPTSFSIKNNGLWSCFTNCGGGDIFNLVALKEGYEIETDFPKIMRKTADILGVSVEGLEIGDRKRSNAKEYKEWEEYVKRKINNNNVYEFNLNTLGALDNVSEYRGINEETLALYMVKYSKDYKRYIFPILNPIGQIIGVTCRADNNTTMPKWLHLPKGLKTGDILYGLQAGRTDTPRLVEGAMDVLACNQDGIYALGCFGANLSENQRNIIIKNFYRVDIMYDGDFAGIKATKNAVDKLKDVVDLRIYILPYQKDYAELTEEEKLELTPLRVYEFMEFYEKIKDKL